MEELSQNRYEMLLDATGAIVWEADAQTLRYRFVSQSAERLLGYRLHRWQDPTFWQDHIHPDDRERVLRHYRHALAVARPFELEYRMIAADGRALLVRDHVRVEVDGGRPTVLRGVKIKVGEVEAVSSLSPVDGTAAFPDLDLAELARRANELAILHRVALATATIVDVDELLRQTTEAIAATLYPDVFGFVLIDRENGTLVPHASYHGIPHDFRNASIPLQGSVVGFVAQSSEARIVTDIRQEPLYFEGVPTTRSEIAVPLKVGEEVIGVVNAESPRVNAFSDGDAHFLITLAGQVAAAIERARLYERLQAQAAALAGQVSQRTAELKAERDRTLTILESAGESIVLTDVTANILYVNPAMERQSGYDRDELLGQNPRILASGHTPRSTYEQMWRTILSGRRWTGELINKHKDGTFYDVAITISPILDAQGEVDGFVSVQSDIRRFKEVERLKSEFVSNISHELRTPLTNIKIYMTLLERGKEESRDQYLQVLHRETDRLTRLIQDLLDLSRLETKDLPDLSLTAPVDRLLNELYRDFGPKAESKAISFQLVMPSTLPAARIEGSHLRQLLTNLLDNAFAYSADGEQVEVEADTRELAGQEMVWIRVTNSGPGIPAEEKPHLFDRFFRGKVAQEKGVPGTGLGLAICKEIVNRYEGFIDVTSQPDTGTSFTVWLLVAVEAV